MIHACLVLVSLNTMTDQICRHIDNIAARKATLADILYCIYCIFRRFLKRLTVD